jgi:hypothetical protein
MNTSPSSTPYLITEVIIPLRVYSSQPLRDKLRPVGVEKLTVTPLLTEKQDGISLKR